MGTVEPSEEVDIAVVLGADEITATRAVQALADADLLSHGVATVAGAAAVRWGIDLVAALTKIADEGGLGQGFSDYELRFGREEAESDLEDAWERGGSADDPVWSRLLNPRSSTTEGEFSAAAETVAPPTTASAHHLAATDVVEVPGRSTGG